MKSILLGTFGVAILIFAVFYSEDSSKFASDFGRDSSKEEITDEFAVFGNKVLGEKDPDLLSEIIEFGEVFVTENIKEDDVSDSNVSGNKVVGVIDGDTIDVEIEGKVERLRLIGINTPETVDPRKEVQCFGIEASNKAKELLIGKFVTLENDDTQQDKDRYGRLLRYVFLPDGASFNKYMISEGFAYEYTYGNPYKYQQEFKQAQLYAQNQNKGLWNSNVCPN